MFEMVLREPPPESAYLTPPPGGERLTGPRFASASFALLKRDAPADSLASLADYVLTYYESSGEVGIQDKNGVVWPVGPVIKGFHVMRQVRNVCSGGIDQACLDEAKAFSGTVTAFDQYRCSMPVEHVQAVEVPLDALRFEVEDPAAPPATLAPCP
jgi:hypothetical protein